MGIKKEKKINNENKNKNEDKNKDNTGDKAEDINGKLKHTDIFLINIVKNMEKIIQLFLCKLVHFMKCMH